MKEKCKCGNIGLWFYGPGEQGSPVYCDNCVPRGCSCNSYSFSDSPDALPLFEQAKDFINGGDFYILDYGQRQMAQGKHIRVIRDKSEIDMEFAKEENLLNFLLVPVDEEGREWPCCEYFYDEEGFDI